MIRNHTRALDISKEKVIAPIVLKQGDINTNTLTLNLWDNGYQMELSNKIVSIVFITPDNKGVYQSQVDLELPVVVDGNSLLVTLRSSILKLSGIVKAEVIIVEGDKYLTSQTITLNVLPTLEMSELISDDVSFPIVESLILQLESLASQYEALLKEGSFTYPGGIV